MGHGSLLAGRYRLQDRVRTGPDGSLWRALDDMLDRPVSIRLVRPGHRYTDDVVDAARRAVLVEDPRLARVLDVGESNGSAYIVSEHLVGRTLAEALEHGPLAAETARRIVGEAAEALDRASARGLHHLRLGPASLVIAPDGAVRVLGTAVEAALAGVERDEDPVGADRADAVGLVRLLYAALTARWPGPTDGALGSAPRVTGRAVPPADLVAGVPNDLDTLCAVTLGPHDDGPQSPGDLARQLAPWAGSEPLTHPRGLAVAGPRRPERSAPAEQSPTDRATEAEEIRMPDRTDRSTAASARHEVGGTGPGPDRTAPAARHATPAVGVSRTAVAEAGLPTLLPRGDAGHDAPVGDVPQVTEQVPADGAGATRAAGGSRPTGRGRFPSRSGHPGEPAPTEGGLSPRDEWAMLTAPPSDAPRETAPSIPPPVDEEPLGPFMPQAPIARPPRDQARFVIALLAGVVVVGLILAVIGLLHGLSSSAPLVEPGPIFPSPSTASPSPSVSVGSSPPGSSPSGSASPTASAAASASPSGEPATISGIEPIDPQGDGSEGGSASRAIDGDESTTWRSDRYKTSSFGGLKDGLGLFLRLSPGTVTSVRIDMPGTGGQVELRTATNPGLDESEVVATAEVQDGAAVLTPAQPITADQLLIWFTSVPEQSSGENRIVVSEITVS